MENVLGSKRTAACLCIKIESAVGESACFQHLIHTKCRIVNICRELVCIPAKQSIPLICIDRTKHVIIARHSQFMLEGMLCKRSVVGFNIHFEIVFKTVFPQKAEYCCSIEIILVFCRFLWFRFDVKVSGISDRTRISDCHFHKTCHIVKFKSGIRIEQRFITFTSAPENIALATKLYGSFYRFLYLRRCKSKNVSRRRSTCTMHISWVVKALCSSPQKLCTGLCLLFLDIVGYFIKLCICFCKTSVFRRQVTVMEAEIIYRKLLHYFKCRIDLRLCPCFGFTFSPRFIGSSDTEHICSVSAHCVPP